MTATETIARGLTEAQREALCQGEAWSGHTRCALQRLGLAGEAGKSYRQFWYSTHRYPFAVTPLGLAVRAILERKNDA